uniref:G_PROTEIN_RECEP_F1_2 domain-containing protein n=1 Tax=Heterorhabditis bacteriophora TaxID=37862 RepID=A0A1I7X6D2_HETBA
MSDTATEIVRVFLLGFNILGTFGNINIMVAVYRTKELRSKCGILLSILAFSNLLCLWYEFQSFIRMTFGFTRTSLVSCYWANVGYIFTEPFAIYVLFALSVDRQIAVQFPVNTKTYYYEYN